jgi:peptidoglycan/xylan/chitin deacetylase (PgdA/CDA1 family)
MKGVMYHYVRPAPAGLPEFYYLHLDHFRRQLDWFGQHFGFVARDDFVDAIEGGRIVDGVVLTFDDGLADHYGHVLPELVARGLWGIFYVPTGVYQTGKLLDVHRIHVLLGRCGADTVSRTLQRIISDDMLVAEHVEAFRTTTYLRQQNDELTTFCKRTLNYFVSYEWREHVLDVLMSELLGADSPDAANYYVARDDLRRMADAGMVVGSHGVSHRLMSRLTDAEQRKEIDQSFAFLDATAGPQVFRTYCHPYGGFHSFNAATEQLLSERGCRFSFNVEARDIARSDLTARPQALPRYDCNGFPYGKASRGTTVASQSLGG